MPTRARDRTAASKRRSASRRAPRLQVVAAIHLRGVIAEGRISGDTEQLEEPSESLASRFVHAQAATHDVWVKRLEQCGMRTLEVVEGSGAKAVVRLLEPAQRRGGAGAMIEERVSSRSKRTARIEEDVQLQVFDKLSRCPRLWWSLLPPI